MHFKASSASSWLMLSTFSGPHLKDISYQSHKACVEFSTDGRWNFLWKNCGSVDCFLFRCQKLGENNIVKSSEWLLLHIACMYSVYIYTHTPPTTTVCTFTWNVWNGFFLFVCNKIYLSIFSHLRKKDPKDFTFS